ncbi:MAG: class I SAM-dependent methyltransferase [Chloroflexaceae bacterium]|jgi:ubiquinone/menaquinone biosynthesis C-methylase UbiE|nr:class I SAM-dependent methyltransferase [Chloroflexaceae bacterium]
MTISISFNQIASAYDGQRAHPPEVAAQIGRALLELVGHGAHVLELGVGTGRMAIPLATAGAHVAGVDIALDMLHIAQGRWRAGEGQQDGLTLAQADIASLPFADNSFDGALAVHVLHLLSDWRSALAEIGRVVRPGGLFIQGNDWRAPDTCVGRLRSQFRQVIIELLPGARPPGAGAALAQALSRLGGSTGEPEVLASWVRPVSPAQVLAGMAGRADTETWVLPDDLLHEAMERLNEWAETQWDDLEALEPVEHRFLATVTQF